MYPAQTTRSTLRPASQSAIAASRASRSAIVVELEGCGRDPGLLGPLERAHAGRVARDRDDRQARVDQRLQVRPLAADEDADHASLPITSRAGRRLGHDRAHPDPAVEDAPQLVLLDAVLGEPGEDRRTLPGVPVELDADAFREDAGQVAEDAAAGHVRERLHVGALAQRRAPRPGRAGAARAAGRRRSRPRRRAAARARTRSCAARTRGDRGRGRPARSGSRRSAARARRSRRRCRRNRAPRSR